MTKNRKKCDIFLSKITIFYLSLALHTEVRQQEKPSEASKENIQHFKT
jgi:hypothetical protein